MKSMIMMTAGFVAALTLSPAAFADDPAVQVQSGDTVKSMLTKSAGQTVGLRVGSGEEIRGKVAKVGDNVVHLTDLSGREFFDAVVPIDAIQAVVIKARSK